MELPETSRLYQAAIAAAKLADQRLEIRTWTDYNGSLTKIPRGGAKRQRCAGNGSRVPGSRVPFAKVGIKWGTPMTDSNFTQVLNIVAAAAGINRSVLGDEIWFTSHCFRRGGAQYRFMFAPEKRRWTLKLVRWWAGWAPSEKAERVTRYLLDDVMDREENQLGDSLAPDVDACINTASLDDLQDVDYGRKYSDADDDSQLNPTFAAPDQVPHAWHLSTIVEIKDALREGLRGMIQGVGCRQNDSQKTEGGEHAEDTCEGTDEKTARLVSELRMPNHGATTFSTGNQILRVTSNEPTRTYFHTNARYTGHASPE